MDVIVTHTNTDFDALASLLAARRLYPGAVAALSGSLNRNVREFYRLHADELDLAETGTVDHDAIERLIVVETVQAERLGEFEPVARRPGVEVVAFDHHQPERPDWIPESGLVTSDDGALTTTLVGILAERELEPTPLEATVFALGIHEDTGSLTYPTVTQRDADALAWCLRHGARQDMVAQYLHTPLGEQERLLFDALRNGLEEHEAGGLTVYVTAVAWPEYVDGISNLVHKLVDLTDARGLVALVEMEERVVCVARARVAELDASAIAGALGGGGHPQASSAVFRGTCAEARELVLAALPGAVRRTLTAGEVMSRPPRFVSPDDTIAHAMVECQRHRQSGILVGDAEKIVGLASREDLDKAMGHELAHAPVKSVMTATVHACDESAPLAEVQRLIVHAGASRVPVRRDGRVVGVVTRSDLLRALDEPVAEPEPAAADLRGRLLALDDLAPAFEAIQAAGEGFDGVYLVGGAVRDVLMGEPTFDVDIAVEGDGIAFGRALAVVLGGRAVPHEKFGTAVVIAGDVRVDVATTRTEFYDRPAALPRVEQATVRQDLFRRDFTINALAVSLKGEDFGRLVDYFGGLEDLEAGVVRVIHPLSFIDDPTRIFRGIRYETRYGFRMDGHTASLARACVEMNLVGELSSARLRDELQQLLSEKRAADAIARMEELGVAAAVHPHITADTESVRLVRVSDELRARFMPEVPAWRARLAVLARPLSPDELFDWFERLRLRRRDAGLVADAVTVAPRLVELLAETDEAAEIRRLVEPHDPDGTLLALVLAGDGPARERLERYLGELRAVSLEITGGDLADLGVSESPRVGEILDELLRRKLNGELDGRSAELEAARELLGAA